MTATSSSYKGNATVVLDRKDYVEKIEDMLKDGAYGKLKKDPTTVEAKVTRVLKKWEKDEHITKKFRLCLQPHCSTPPQLYGLPKIHKGVPLRSATHSHGYWVPHLQHHEIPNQDHQPLDRQI